MLFSLFTLFACLLPQSLLQLSVACIRLRLMALCDVTGPASPKGPAPLKSAELQQLLPVLEVLFTGQKLPAFPASLHAQLAAQPVLAGADDSSPTASSSAAAMPSANTSQSGAAAAASQGKQKDPEYV